MGIDYRRLFAETLEDRINAVMARHGIDTLYEDEYESIVRECTSKCYAKSNAEFRRETGESSIPKIRLW